VIITMGTVRVMQMSAHDIVGMFAVRHGLMATVRAMGVPAVVSVAGVIRRARRGVPPVQINHMFVHMFSVHEMQVAVVKIVGVAVMPDPDVTAMRPVNVPMRPMLVAGHRESPFRSIQIYDQVHITCHRAGACRRDSSDCRFAHLSPDRTVADRPASPNEPSIRRKGPFIESFARKRTASLMLFGKCIEW
jgi:hypothetical protein